MRSSAPRNRVVLAAIDRPRLGGEEPRDPHESEAIFAHAFTKLQWRIPQPAIWSSADYTTRGRKFYETLPKLGRVGMKATGHTHWFGRMPPEFGIRPCLG